MGTKTCLTAQRLPEIGNADTETINSGLYIATSRTRLHFSFNQMLVGLTFFNQSGVR